MKAQRFSLALVFNDAQTSDFTIVIPLERDHLGSDDTQNGENKVTFHVHQQVLMGQSPYFRRFALTSHTDTTEPIRMIIARNADPTAMELVLRFFYLQHYHFHETEYFSFIASDVDGGVVPAFVNLLFRNDETVPEPSNQIRYEQHRCFMLFLLRVLFLSPTSCASSPAAAKGQGASASDADVSSKADDDAQELNLLRQFILLFYRNQVGGDARRFCHFYWKITKAILHVWEIAVHFQTYLSLSDSYSGEKVPPQSNATTNHCMNMTLAATKRLCQLLFESQTLAPDTNVSSQPMKANQQRRNELFYDCQHQRLSANGCIPSDLYVLAFDAVFIKFSDIGTRSFSSIEDAVDKQMREAILSWLQQYFNAQIDAQLIAHHRQDAFYTFPQLRTGQSGTQHNRPQLDAEKLFGTMAVSSKLRQVEKVNEHIRKYIHKVVAHLECKGYTSFLQLSTNCTGDRFLNTLSGGVERNDQLAVDNDRRRSFYHLLDKYTDLRRKRCIMNDCSNFFSSQRMEGREWFYDNKFNSRTVTGGSVLTNGPITLALNSLMNCQMIQKSSSDDGTEHDWTSHEFQNKYGILHDIHDLNGRLEQLTETLRGLISSGIVEGEQGEHDSHENGIKNGVEKPSSKKYEMRLNQPIFEQLRDCLIEFNQLQNEIMNGRGVSCIASRLDRQDDDANASALLGVAPGLQHSKKRFSDILVTRFIEDILPSAVKVEVRLLKQQLELLQQYKRLWYALQHRDVEDDGQASAGRSREVEGNSSHQLLQWWWDERGGPDSSRDKLHETKTAPSLPSPSRCNIDCREVHDGQLLNGLLWEFMQEEDRKRERYSAGEYPISRAITQSSVVEDGAPPTSAGSRSTSAFVSFSKEFLRSEVKVIQSVSALRQRIVEITTDNRMQKKSTAKLSVTDTIERRKQLRRLLTNAITQQQEERYRLNHHHQHHRDESSTAVLPHFRHGSSSKTCGSATLDGRIVSATNALHTPAMGTQYQAGAHGATVTEVLRGRVADVSMAIAAEMAAIEQLEFDLSIN